MDDFLSADGIVSGLDGFGLPRAVGNLGTNRIIAWNESSRNQIQCSDKDLCSVTLDAVVSLDETEALPLISAGAVAVFSPCGI
jgi:hypothetical protein